MTVLPSKAVVYPKDANAHVDAEIEPFVEALGFIQLDPAYFNSPEWNSQERFPFGDSPFGGIRDWGMPDAGKAIMALEALEPPLPTTRYRVGVSDVDVDADDPNVMRPLAAARLNLGPALAATTRETYGDQLTPSPQDIGMGPHTAYRFAMFTERGPPNQIAARPQRGRGA